MSGSPPTVAARLAAALEPRDRTSTARTLLIVVVLAAVVTVAWEIYALALHRPTSTPASTLRITAVMVGLVVGAMACRRAADRVPAAVLAAFPVLGVGLAVWVALSSADASAAGQVGLLYPVVYAAAHFRTAFAWTVAALAAVGDAVIAVSLLPLADALADIAVVGTALAMLTLVLVTSGRHQDDLVARLNALAAADPLTGLATRRGLEEAAARLLRPAGTPGGAGGAAPGGTAGRRHSDIGGVGLVLLDVDRFKHLNDTHGHPVGDAVLVHLGELVRAAVRPTDTVARLGGDELAILLPGPPAEVHERARTVHRMVRDAPLPAGALGAVGATPPTVTVSVGVAHGRAGEVTFAELYAAADAALYAAKDAGRDTVVVTAV